MKLNKKALTALISIPVTALVFPILAVNFAPADAGMAITFLLLFTVYPLQSIIIGAVAGSDIRRLWYLPLCLPAAVPLLFSLAFLEMIWELWTYSPFYLLLGAIAAATIAFSTYRREKRNK